jgi:O-antigen/teichoic acid export membrane protein
MTEPISPLQAGHGEPASGGQARLLASGSLMQQFSQVTGLLAMLAIVTVLGRRLALSEFGVYGLLASLAGYLLVIQNSAASAGVRNMAAAADEEGRAGAFSTALLLYVAAGVVTGALLAGVGVVLAAAVDLSGETEHQARLGALLLGGVTAVGWPITIYRDALRARQLFVRAASIEVLSLVVYAALVLSLAFGGASLAVLIGASGTIPFLTGLASAVAAKLSRVPFRFRPATVTAARLREFARLAWYVSLTEAAGTVIYALDRVILGLFRSAATVGLYEGPVRAHNMVRALNAAVTVTVLPTAAKFYADSDVPRLSELLVRGARYTLALAVPLTVTGMVLAPDILDVWLGARFREGGLAMAILMSYWLVNGCTGVIAGILVACERAKTLARYAWAVAITNLVVSLALTPPLGLEGVTIGTAVPYLAAFPFLVGVVLRQLGVPFPHLLREAFLPAWIGGAVLAAGLGIVRLAAEPATLVAVAGLAVGGVLAYWVAFYGIFMRPYERRLVREVALGFIPARRATPSA